MARGYKNTKGRGYLCTNTDATYSWYVQKVGNSIFSELKLRDCYRSISLGFDSIPQGKKATKKNLRKEVQASINKIKVIERAGKNEKRNLEGREEHRNKIEKRAQVT